MEENKYGALRMITAEPRFVLAVTTTRMAIARLTAASE
jgi:hypothetical protein